MTLSSTACSTNWADQAERDLDSIFLDEQDGNWADAYVELPCRELDADDVEELAIFEAEKKRQASLTAVERAREQRRLAAQRDREIESYHGGRTSLGDILAAAMEKKGQKS